MKDMGLVYGSAAQAVPLIVGKDTVYLHTDIEKVEELPDGGKVQDMYSYHEIQYTKDEFIHRLAIELTDTQEALCDVYEAGRG